VQIALAHITPREQSFTLTAGSGVDDHVGLTLILLTLSNTGRRIEVIILKLPIDDIVSCQPEGGRLHAARLRLPAMKKLDFH